MPIASFLEEYNFSGKSIVPFCSNSGGRFGQSLTAIAKPAPGAVPGEGLSVYDSGDSSPGSNIDAWISGGSIILPGVTIGNNVVVGAGSVNTRSIPDNSIACGNPCAVKKENME